VINLAEEEKREPTISELYAEVMELREMMTMGDLPTSNRLAIKRLDGVVRGLAERIEELVERIEELETEEKGESEF